METDPVHALFSEKAATWNQKYSPDGPLQPRLAGFHQRLSKFVTPPAEVLDLGCGTGNLAAYLAEYGYALTGCDFAVSMMQEARAAHPRARVEWIALPSNWQQLPFASGRFDAIVASSVLEYLPTLDAVLKECRRILKPGGVLIATVPDPANLVRKLEEVIRPILVPLSSIGLLRPLRKVQNYATYLQSSGNRMPIESWKTIASRAQLVLITEERRPAARTTNPPLMFMVFRATV